MPTPGQIFHFGAFSLHPASRLLLEDGRPVRLGARALDLLIALVEQAGEVIPKEELFRRVWPSTIVEETSLRVHIVALRKALGGAESRYIANIPGKGYSFIGALDRQAVTAPLELPVAPRRPSRHNLPLRLTRMIGRSATSEGISSALLTRRLVTITGEGGVGKTTLALAVAESNLDEYADGTVFVDLASCLSPSLIVSTVGRAIGLLLPPSSPPHLLCEALKGQRFLLVLDNCEHVISDAADLVTELLRRLPVLRILATSREPLRAVGEHVHRLDTLPVPPATGHLTADQAMAYAAIQLLVERVSAATDGYVLTDADARHAAELCARLDGIPLAIELAAARVGFFGLQGLLHRLHDRLQILTSGHRTVMPRHRTLRALYDWSFDLLGPDAQLAFARLAVFPASFSLEAGLAMMPCSDRASALPMLLDLISKSLVAIDFRGEKRRYRLLDTARVYAAEKLIALGVHRDAHLQHARCVLRFVELANKEWEPLARPVWISRHGLLSEDIRAVLQWAQAESGEALLYAQIADASFLLFQELSQLEVLHPHLKSSLNALVGSDLPHPDLARRLTVLIGQALSHLLPIRSAIEEWLTQARPLLERPDATPDILYAATAIYMGHGEYRLMLKSAERLELSAEYHGDPESAISARRFQAAARHHLGQFAVFRRLADEVVRYPKPTLRKGMPFDTVDRRVPMGILLARTSWLEGDSVESESLLSSIGELVGQQIERSQCQFLSMTAIPVSMWSGRQEQAVRYLVQLQNLVERPNLGDFWNEWAVAYSAVIEGKPPSGEILSAKLLDVLGTIAPEFDDERMLARAHSGLAGWSAAEVIRNQGERLKAGSPEGAESLFTKALALAREQGAARWELRAAMSLARLAVASGRPVVQAQALMSPLARIMTDTPDRDLVEAALLIQALARLH